MSDSRHLNFFRPFDRLPAHHENQLTRAFLVVLDKVPIAHAAWLRLVNAGYQGDGSSDVGAFERLPSPITVRTQQGSLEGLGSPEGSEETAPEDRPRLLSVIQSAELVEDEAEVIASDRRGVLDGVVYYGDRLAIVIESKLGQPATDVQYTRISAPGWRVDGHPAAVSWRELIAAWRGLVEGDLLGHTERKVLLDFLWFVEDSFPSLQPFSRLGLCRGNPYLATMRCEAILADVAASQTVTEHSRQRARLELGGANTVRYAYLSPAEADSRVEMSIYPGDDLGQARELYASPDQVKALLRLEEWSVVPNMHFGFMQRGYAWSPTPATVDEYVDYWIGQIDSAKTVAEDHWDEYLDDLISNRIISEDGRRAFEEVFVHSERTSATPRPGLLATTGWTFDEAAELDGHGRLAGEVRVRLHKALDGLQEPHP